MRHFFIRVLLCAAVAQVACGGGNAEKTAETNRPATATTLAHGPSANVPPASTTPPAAAPPVASSHGASAPSVPSAGQGRASADTAALDAKIAGALAKAKAPKAGAAEKKAAALAYLERGNVYWSAGDPTLYKFALADFKSVLVYDPANAEAASKRDEIVRIYRAMNRPVPELSNEK
ncbi:MAG TPA: hypothetical protein VF240_18895 [Pyrinomonadaceae bacterium]